MLHLRGGKVRNASGEICVRSRRSAVAAGRQEHNLVLTRGCRCRSDLRRDRRLRSGRSGHRSSQGKGPDSHPRFLDKEGARGAGLGVVHQLFTSKDADPGVMAPIGPQRERFPPPRANGRCRFGQGTFAGRSGNDEDAP